jgi:hypothetical protein
MYLDPVVAMVDNPDFMAYFVVHKNGGGDRHVL